MIPKPIRCAIYTRKSTEHNLDLEFNSLHAQRESCEAYIKSQMHEGWQLIPDRYDDGGISGASLNRPNLQHLLNDIATGKVDNIVVYKVDRLTRSLTDFARLVEIFDKHGVSFVSVTQSFNTTSSMGRLTLNVLLSFAQFEREVIGERVKDKIAASKKKGLFMGGNLPLGYINSKKKLVIIPKEAERVRWIFKRYLELGSIDRLLEEMNRLGFRTKGQTLSNGKQRGGVPFGKGALAYLLRNRSYVAEILHHGAVHSADHEAIIDRNTFDAVQTSLTTNTIERKVKSKASQFLLTGLLFDSAGNRMTPSHSRKKGVRYRYYVSQAILQSRRADAGQVSRVSAPDIEALIEHYLRNRCRDAHANLRMLVQVHIGKVTLERGSVNMELLGQDGAEREHTDQPRQIVCLPWSKNPPRTIKGAASSPAITCSTLGAQSEVNEAILIAIANARRWVNELMAGNNLTKITKQESKSERIMRMHIPLAFLSPRAFSENIGGQGIPCSATQLAKNVPLAWNNTLVGAADEISRFDLPLIPVDSSHYAFTSHDARAKTLHRSARDPS